MSKDQDKKGKATEPKQSGLILSGDPAKDFPAWLKSKEKDFDLGIELIRKHAKNNQLINFLKNNRETATAKTTMIKSIQAISKKWRKI